MSGSPRATAWRRYRRHKLATAGGIAIAVLVAAAALAGRLTPYRMTDIGLSERFQPPSARHLLGTDDLGHDVLTRTLFAGRISLGVGAAAGSLGAVIGTTVGVTAAYCGGWVNQALMRTTDAMIALPLIGVMFVLAKYLGPGVLTILIVLVMFGWMGTARLVAGEVLKLKGQDFVEAARAAGATDRRIIVRHLVPNSLYVTIVSATFLVGEAIQLESIISYFGLGIQPPTPSWGNMLQNAQEYLLSAPYLAVFPGAFIFITVLAFNFMGDGLRDALDPRLKL